MTEHDQTDTDTAATSLLDKVGTMLADAVDAAQDFAADVIDGDNSTEAQTEEDAATEDDAGELDEALDEDDEDEDGDDEDDVAASEDQTEEA